MVEICLVKASTVCPDFLVRTMRLKYTNDKAVTGNYISNFEKNYFFDAND